MNFPIGETVSAFLLDLAFKSLPATMAAVAVAKLLFPARRAGASTRHLIWLCTIIGLLLLPLASLVLPVTPLLHFPPLSTLAAIPSDGSSPLPSAPLPQDPETPSSAALQPAPAAAAEGVVSKDSESLPAPGSVEPNFTSGMMGSVLAVAWIAVTALLAVRILVSLLVVLSASRREYVSPGPGATTVDALLQARETVGVRQTVSVRIANGATALPPVPMTLGVFRPTILLPAAAADWPADLLQAVLCHEMAHIRRRDWAWQVCAEVTAAFYWWNPLVWLAARNLRSESEECCDDLVITSGMPPSEYAAHLVRVVEILRKIPKHNRVLTAVSMVEKPEITRRVEAVLSENNPRHTLNRRVFAGIVLTACALFVPLAALRSAGSADLSRNREAFPGGLGTAEVISVAYGDARYPTVWAPDGTVLSASKVEVPGAIRKNVRTLKILLSGISEEDHTVFGFYTNTSYIRGLSGVAGGAYNSRGRSRIYTIRTAPVEEKTTTFLEVKLASGPWTTLHQWLPNMVSPADAVQLTTSIGGYPAPFDSIRLRYKKPEQIGGDTLLPLLNNGPMLVDWRVTAMLRDGTSVSGRDRNASRKGDEGESQPSVISGKVLFPGVRLKDIVRFEFQVRPYRFVTLKNIALHPNRSPGATRVSKRSNDSVTLPNRAVVQFLGVTDAENRGGKKNTWWGIQGDPLASAPLPISEDDAAGIQSSDVRAKRVSAFRITGGTKDKKVTVVQVSPEGVPFGATGLRSGDAMGANLYSVQTGILRNQSALSLRVGVSSGSWENGTEWGSNLYRRGRRGAAGTRTFSNRQGEGSVIYREPTQEGRDVGLIVSHNLQEADWRIVAVLKDGRTVVGKDGSAARSSITMGDLLFPNVKVESIALFRFQTRDYKYATFKNIALNPRESSADASL